MIKNNLYKARNISSRINRESYLKNKKVMCTRTSQAVPHLSTNLALSRLTSEFGWDPVL